MVDARRDVRTQFIGQDRTGAAARSASRNVASVGVAYDRVSRQVQRTNQIIASATLGIGGSSVLKTAADLQNAQLRLSIYTRNLARDQEYLAKTSQRLSIDLSSATDALARLRVLENAGAISSGQSEQFLEGLTDVFTAFGASQGRQENVLYGLFQALGQGTVQAQELNQVIEPLPGLLNDLAEQAGVTAVEYRELVKSGQLLSTQFGEDLFGVFAKYAGTAEGAAGNIQQTLTRLSNQYKLTLQDLSEPIGDGITVASDVLIASIRIVAQYLEEIVAIAAVYAATIGAQFVGAKLRAIREYTSAFVSSTGKRIKAMEDETQAYKLRSVGEARARAKAEKIRATQDIATARTGLTGANQLQEEKQLALLAKERSRIKATDLALNKELKVVELARQREVAQAAKISLSAEKERLKVRESVLAGNLAVAKTEDAAKKRGDELLKVRQRLNVVNKEYGAALKSIERLPAQIARQQELAARATRTAIAAKEAELRVTRQLQAANIAQSEQLAALNAATTRRANAFNKLAAASVAFKNTVKATNVVMGAQLVASRALAGGLRLLSGAFNLIGGPLGAAVLAGLAILEFRRRAKAAAEASGLGQLTSQIEKMKEKLSELKDETGAASEELTSLALARREMSELQAELDAIDTAPLTKGLGDLIQRWFDFSLLGRTVSLTGLDIFETSTEIEEKLQKYRETIEEVIRLSSLLRNLNQAQGVGNYADLLDQARQIAAAASTAAAEFVDFDNPVDLIEQQITAIQRALSNANVRGQIGDAGIDFLTRGLEAAEKKLADVSGETKRLADIEKALEEQRRAAERAQQEQSRFTIGLLSEEGQARERAAQQIKDLEARSRVAGSGVSQADVSVGTALVQQQLDEELRKTRLESLKASNQAELALRQELADSLRARDPVLAAYKDLSNELLELAQRREEGEIGVIENYATLKAAAVARGQQAISQSDLAIRQELADALRASDPVLAAYEDLSNELLALQQRRLQGEITAIENYLVLKKAIVIAGEQAIAAAVKKIQDERDESIKTEQSKQLALLDAEAQLAKGLFELAKGPVNEYIAVTENMTEAERNAARESNAINKRRFERNKKLRIAQATIDTYAGANKALAEEGWLGQARAFSIIAFGLANVSKIRSESFGGSAAAASATGSRLNSDDGGRLSSADSESPVNITQWIVTADELVDRDKFEELASHAIANATQARRLQFDTRNNAYRVAA